MSATPLMSRELNPGRAPPGHTYVVYAYQWRPNVSCDACNWLVQGLCDIRDEAEAHAARLVRAERRAKVRLEPDV